MFLSQLVLLLVGAMHSAAVRAAITKILEPYVCISTNLDVGGTIHETPMYRLLESILGAKWG